MAAFKFNGATHYTREVGEKHGPTLGEVCWSSAKPDTYRAYRFGSSQPTELGTFPTLKAAKAAILATVEAPKPTEENDYATAAYDVDVYKGDPKNGNLVANYTVIGFEEAQSIAARFTEDGRQCVIQRFDKQPLIGEFDYWCKKIGAYPFTASDGRTYPAIKEATA